MVSSWCSWNSGVGAEAGVAGKRDWTTFRHLVGLAQGRLLKWVKPASGEAAASVWGSIACLCGHWEES